MSVLVLGALVIRRLSLVCECTVVDRFAAQGSLWRRPSSIWRREQATEAAPQGLLQVVVLPALSLRSGCGHVLLACSTGSNYISLFPCRKRATRKEKEKEKEKGQEGYEKGKGKSW